MTVWAVLSVGLAVDPGESVESQAALPAQSARKPASARVAIVLETLGEGVRFRAAQCRSLIC